MSCTQKSPWSFRTQGFDIHFDDDTRFFTVPLDAVKIRQAKAGDKPTKLAGFDGPDLLVKPSGSKLWRYKYRIAGEENLFAIGEGKAPFRAERGSRSVANWVSDAHLLDTTSFNDWPVTSRDRIRTGRITVI
ncbi:Arm DNA-binding domain-containing protein [Burkholderia contaminans]|uniref:Arm DNA-binding domain-containing protein n=1 Tax=Burkholderia contaminans TaxID=488447 RepID=UPI00158358F2|nr:Arm DNA-binding domain-containing protein [Burkholderia contaminans]